jgi:hypothetical protein
MDQESGLANGDGEKRVDGGDKIRRHRPGNPMAKGSKS